MIMMLFKSSVKKYIFDRLIQMVFGNPIMSWQRNILSE